MVRCWAAATCTQMIAASGRSRITLRMPPPLKEDLRADRVPGCLEFDEVANLVSALHLRIKPVDVVTLAGPDALDAFRRTELQLLLFFLIDDGVDATNVRVRRERRHELLSESRQEVDDTTREIGNRQQLTEHDRGIRKFLGGETDTGVAGDDYGCNLTYQSEQRRPI